MKAESISELSAFYSVQMLLWTKALWLLPNYLQHFTPKYLAGQLYV